MKEETLLVRNPVPPGQAELTQKQPMLSVLLKEKPGAFLIFFFNNDVEMIFCLLVCLFFEDKSCCLRLCSSPASLLLAWQKRMLKKSSSKLPAQDAVTNIRGSHSTECCWWEQPSCHSTLGSGILCSHTATGPQSAAGPLAPGS